MAPASDILNEFEAFLYRSELARNTVTGYLHDLRGFQNWLSRNHRGTASAAGFAPEDVEAYKTYLREDLGRSPASINRYVQSVRKYGEFARNAGLCERNPAQGVHLVAGGESSAPQVLADGDVERLISASRKRQARTAVRDCAILQLLLQTGIRASELVALRLADLDLGENQGTLTVAALGKRPGRSLPLGTGAREALRDYVAQPRPPGTAYLFLGRDVEPLSVRSVQQVVASLGQAGGLHVTAKMLRDTYAAALWRRTGDLNLLAEQLGLRRAETALRYLSPLSLGDNSVSN